MNKKVLEKKVLEKKVLEKKVLENKVLEKKVDERTAGESPKNSKIDHASNQESENGSESDSDDASAQRQDHICSEDDTDDITDGDNNNSGVRWSRWTPIFDKSHLECYSATGYHYKSQCKYCNGGYTSLLRKI